MIEERQLPIRRIYPKALPVLDGLFWSYKWKEDTPLISIKRQSLRANFATMGRPRNPAFLYPAGLKQLSCASTLTTCIAREVDRDAASSVEA